MSDVPPPPPGFTLVPPPPPGFTVVEDSPKDDPVLEALFPTGQAHDGDTFRLTNGQNARLYGVDAFELDQQGRRRGILMPIGEQSRDYLLPRLPGSTAMPTGDKTYGRPVASLSNGGSDIGQYMLRHGWGLATPEYLKGDPDRFQAYMEAERLARLNRLGAHAGEFQSPKSYRDGNPDPWAKPQEGQRGNSDAVFFDDPTPFQGLRPEIEQGYLAIAKDPASTAADLVAYARQNGFQIDPRDADKFIAERGKGRPVADEAVYQAMPQVLTNQGDGAVGAGVRGLSDPFNMLDELGGMVDTVGLTDGRENIWNSDRRFGDVLWNNIDQNRSILAYDDMEHPYARFGGQLASGLVLPGASVEGVGLRAATAALRSGSSRYLAESAANAAVRSRLAMAGSVEGGLAGFGAAEGGPVDRLPSAAFGAATGYGLGYGTAALAQEAIPLVPRLLGGKGRGTTEFSAAPSAYDDIPPPPPGFTIDTAHEAAIPSQSLESTRLADDWSAMEAGKARYQRTIADLWRQTPEELEALHSQAMAKERADLMDAATRSGMELSPELRRTIEQGSIERAGTRLAEALDKHFGGNIPDDIDRLVNPRWADHQDGGLPNSDDVDEVLKAYGLIIPTDDDHSIASEMGWALRKLNTGDLEAVARGEGGATQQAAMATVREGYRILGDRGVNKDSVPPMISEAMVRNGVPPHLANELTGQLFDMLRQAAGPRSEMGGRTAALSGSEVPPPPAGFTIDMPNESGNPWISSPRLIDRIDVNNRARPMGAEPTDAQRYAQSQRIEPGDILPIPSNEVGSMDEAARISDGLYPEMRAPNEASGLSRHNIPSPVDATRTLAQLPNSRSSICLRSNSTTARWRGSRLIF